MQVILYPVFGAVLSLKRFARSFSVAKGHTLSESRSAYDFEFSGIEGSPLPLSAFSGKAILIVNTASQCGFTHQYEGLQAVWSRFRDEGLVVLGVPCNEFGGQEPGTAAEILSFCETGYSVDFPMTDKVSIQGDAGHPFYQWALQTLGPQNAPVWNFHKYLISPQGHLVSGFPSTVRPDSNKLVSAIQAVLPKCDL